MLPLLFALYLLAFWFGLSPYSDSHWIAYGLVEELRVFLIPVGICFALFNVKNWKFLLLWLGLSVITIFVVGLPSWGSRPASSGKTLKVLTYNVAGYEIDKPGVMKVLKESNADIIFLQEGCKTGQIRQTCEALSKELGGYFWTGASNNLILSRYPISDEKILKVPTKWPTKEYPSAVVSTPLGKIRVMCVHLEPSWVAAWPPAFGGAVQTLSKVCEDRRAQTDLVLASLVPSKEPIILAGDFNGPPRSESVLRFGKRFTDCFAATEKGLGNTILAKMPYKRIDYVWVRGLTPIQSEVVDSVASDHRAMLTVLGR